MGLKIGYLLPLVLMLQVFAASTEDSPHACCDGANIVGKKGCQGSDINGNKLHLKLQCDQGIFVIDPSTDSSDAFTVEYGELVINNGTHRFEEGRFCITKRIIVKTTDESTPISSGTEYGEIAMTCFQDSDDDDISLTYTVTGSLIITSVVFLILTLIVYVLVPELRDLQGKCIMCTCVSLSLGFLLLAITQLFMHHVNQSFCTFIAFLTYYWMLTIFFWMNVVSINVWRSVACRKTSMSETRIFQLYNLYGWGVPLLFLLAAFIAHHADGEHIKPGFGYTSCWLAGNAATWAYFYGAVAILIIANIVLFIITSLKLWHKTTYENVTVMRSMKFKFLLYLKLFLVMGISWTFEIMSFIHDQSHIVWVIMDTFNCLQGVVFFLVLVVFRRRAIRGLVERGLLPQSWSTKGSKSLDEECDDIIPEEEARTMVAA